MGLYICIQLHYVRHLWFDFRIEICRLFHYFSIDIDQSHFQLISALFSDHLGFYTDKPKELRDAFMECCDHGMTIFEATGGYKHKKVYMCKSIVSVYEAKDTIHHVRKKIPNVIINTYRTQSFYGSFHQQAIE